MGRESHLYDGEIYDMAALRNDEIKMSLRGAFTRQCPKNVPMLVDALLLLLVTFLLCINSWFKLAFTTLVATNCK